MVPGPQGIPADYLSEPPAVDGEIRSKTKPNDERVLRCTSTIRDKQLKFDEYRAKGIIGVGDCTVIAVNICRLSDLDTDGNGISRYPLSMEAVFPIGPLAVPISRDGNIDGPAQNTLRFMVRKAGSREIETTSFLSFGFCGCQRGDPGASKAYDRRGFGRVDNSQPARHEPSPDRPVRPLQRVCGTGIW